MTAVPTISSSDNIVVSQDRKRGTGKGKAIFSAVVVGSFFLLSLVGLFQHEMWRDELQAWLISQDSNTVFELIDNLRYEGHPVLWYLILQAITRFTHDPIAMQFCHLLIATGTVCLITVYSPFSRLQKVLIAFGYFPFFEYGLICRSYALGLLFVFAFCACRSRTQNYLLLFGVLSLLANTSYAGAILAIALACGLLVERLIATRDSLSSFFSRAMIGGIILFSIALAFSVYVMLPPAGTATAKLDPNRLLQAAPRNPGRVSASLSAPLAGYLPIQYPIGKIWSIPTLQYQQAEPNYLLIVSSLGLCSLFLYAFRNAPLPAVAFSLATAGLMVWNFVYPGAIRQQGHFFVIWLACRWLQQSRSDIQLSPKLFSMPRILGAATITILATHAFFGVASYLSDLSEPFSPSRDLSRFLVQKKLDKYPIVVIGNMSGVGVAGYLQRKLYSLVLEKDYSFIPRQPRGQLSKEIVMARLAEYSKHHKQFVLIVCKKLQVIPNNVVLIYRTKRCVASSERSFVYLYDQSSNKKH